MGKLNWIWRGWYKLNTCVNWPQMNYIEYHKWTKNYDDVKATNRYVEHKTSRIGWHHLACVCVCTHTMMNELSQNRSCSRNYNHWQPYTQMLRPVDVKHESFRLKWLGHESKAFYHPVGLYTFRPPPIGIIHTYAPLLSGHWPNRSKSTVY